VDAAEPSYADKRLRSELCIPTDTAEELAALRKVGIASPWHILALTREPAFGPRSGQSDAARILRALRMRDETRRNGGRVIGAFAEKLP
jgi:hypothetical protein